MLSLRKKSIIFASLVFSIFCCCIARAMPVDKVPNPQTASGSFVEDQAQAIGPEYAGLIDGIARELESKTSAELAVVTVDNLEGGSVEDYAVRLFKRFGIGKKDKNNGILILFSRDDRKVRMEVGYGLEPIINDAKAGRLLDEYAIPKFKEGEYGRGLYDTAKTVAETIAKAEGVALAIAEPEEMPSQPESQDAEETIEIKEEPAISLPFTNQLGIFAFAMVASVLLGFLVTFLRIVGYRAKAARENSLGKGVFMPSVVWIAGGFAMIFIAEENHRVLLPIVTFLSTAISLTFAHIGFRKVMKGWIAGYRAVCPKCKAPMQLVSEFDDDRFLMREEIAEEVVGGMDYEFWRCDACHSMERFDVKMGKAKECPKCGRRTLTNESETIEAATTSHSGRKRITYTCENPGCDYKRVEERTIPREGSSSGSSFGSSSGGSSFGGGSSGGGGASRGW